MNHSQACRAVGMSRNSKYYKAVMPLKDAPVIKAIETITNGSRKGRMKVIKMVQRKHPEFGSSRIRRVYEQQGFSLNRKPKRRVAHNPSNPISLAFKPNEEWALDFMSDALIDGRKIRMLNIVDHCNRMCLGVKVSLSLPTRRVIEFLERAIEKYGKPLRIRTDNGPEFISKVFQQWMHDNKIDWCKIPKGRPDQNAIIERFNRTYREDVLDANLFKTIGQVQEISDKWIIHYNEERPHQSLQYKTPFEYAAA